MATDVRTLACTYYDGYHIEPHAHAWGQLIYAAEGVMRVEAGGRSWLVPPARAVWAPPGLTHEIRARGDFVMRTVYLPPDLAVEAPADCRAIEVAPLLRELVLELVGRGLKARGVLPLADPVNEHLTRTLLDQLTAAPVLPLCLPMPTDRRCLAVAERLARDPADDASLEQIARDAGASPRTLQRLFRDETGLRFSEWRQRLRLLHAAALLGGGASVTEAGLEAGYAGASAFIAAFRRQMGHTPARYRPGG